MIEGEQKFACQFLFRDNQCCWRLVSGSNELPSQGDLVSEDDDPDFDNCRPVTEHPSPLNPDYSFKTEVIVTQMRCSKFESSRGKEPFIITPF